MKVSNRLSWLCSEKMMGRLRGVLHERIPQGWCQRLRLTGHLSFHLYATHVAMSSIAAPLRDPAQALHAGAPAVLRGSR
jgi:hypothetical protein